MLSLNDLYFHLIRVIQFSLVLLGGRYIQTVLRFSLFCLSGEVVKIFNL